MGSMASSPKATNRIMSWARIDLSCEQHEVEQRVGASAVIDIRVWSTKYFHADEQNNSIRTYGEPQVVLLTPGLSAYGDGARLCTCAATR